jgi:hypothetical protein
LVQQGTSAINGIAKIWSLVYRGKLHPGDLRKRTKECFQTIKNYINICMLKYLLRYLIFVGIPYSIAKKIEKRYLRSKSNSDNKPDSPPTDLRGGEIFTATGIIALLMKDLAFKAAITGLVGSSIWYDTADNAVEQVLKYASVITAAPGHKFIKIIKRFRNIDNNHALDIKEILLEKNISNREKCELIKLKVQYSLKNIKGKKRVTFITATIALLVFFLGNGTPVFSYFMASLRELLGGEDDQDSLKSYIIDIYREYNAPLPKELITQVF